MPQSQAIKVFFSFFILSLDLHNILRDRVTSFVLIHKKCSLVSSDLCTYSRIYPFLFRRAGNGKTKEPFSREREKGDNTFPLAYYDDYYYDSISEVVHYITK